ncbi:MAG TPA: hypothetical protein VF459_00065 [Caulobacteraceae bacterium]
MRLVPAIWGPAMFVMALLAVPSLGAATTPAPAAAKPALAARWQLIEGTDQVAGGIGLRWLKSGGDTDVAVGLLACRSPTGIYVSVDGVTPKPGVPAIDVLLTGGAFAVPVASPAQEGQTVEALGATPAGLLDALETTATIQLTYDGQTAGVFAAPDARVMKGFIASCRLFETPHGQGS